MRIASLQRLTAWPGVCRGLLSEKDEDSSLPIGLWDQPASSRGAGVGGGGSGRGGGELNGREARLSPEQREALRMLLGNLASHPATARSRRWWRSGGAGAGAGAAEAAAEVTSGVPLEACPHHHHTVPGPTIPYGMGSVELPTRYGGRSRAFLHGGGGGANAGGAGAFQYVGGGGANAGAAGAAAAAAAAAAAGAGGDLAGHGGPIAPGSPHHGGGSTLQNAQPACSMGGLFWPTLYDLTIAKRRQRERLRDSFRKFSRGQKLDVRDPSGIWMGAEVVWAPREGSRAASAAEAAAAAAHTAAGGAGGAGAALQGGGGNLHGVLGGAADPGIPEWRRLLQMGLMVDGGHMGMNANANPQAVLAAANAAAANAHAANANAAAVAAAAAAANNNGNNNNNGPGPNNQAALSSSVAINDGGDWVTTGAVDIAQVHLAAAVTAAADSRRMQLWSARAGAASSAAAPFSSAPPSPAGNGVAPTPVSALEAAPAGNSRKSILVHYEGHKSKYDEWINVHSPRLAPFRSRTTRPLSVTMQSVEKVVNGASVRCVALCSQRLVLVSRGRRRGVAWRACVRVGGFFLATREVC